jgi:predicted HTH transcriptional regulator
LGIIKISQICLGEALVNALIHRDYFIDSCIRLFVFDNRVEIISPGNLPKTVTTENIKMGIQVVRNPILIPFINKIGISYGGIGSGITRMIKERREVKILAPILENDKKSPAVQSDLRKTDPVTEIKVKWAQSRAQTGIGWRRFDQKRGRQAGGAGRPRARRKASFRPASTGGRLLSAKWHPTLI